MRNLDSFQVPPRRRIRSLVVGASAFVVIVLATAYTSGWRLPPLRDAKRPSPAPYAVAISRPRLVGIQFLSVKVGFVELDRRPHTGAAGLYRTTDGGRSWRLLWEGAPAWFHFFDSDRGLIVAGFGGPLLGTSNGGSRWKELPMPAATGAAISFAFASPLDGLALVADPQPAGTTSSGARLYRTQDGAAHWQLVNQTNPGFGALPLAGRMTQLGYAASGTAWLVITGKPETPTVLVSRDAGSSWIPAPLPVRGDSLVAPFVNVCEAQGTIFASAQWVRGPLHVNGSAISWTQSAGPAPAAVYVLASGQQNWQVQQIPSVPFGQVVAGYNAGVTWAVDADQVCRFAARDSGCFTPGNVPALTLDRLVVFDDQSLLGISSATDGGAVVSEDGGGSWTTVVIPKD